MEYEKFTKMEQIAVGNALSNYAKRAGTELAQASLSARLKLMPILMGKTKEEWEKQAGNTWWK